MALSVSGGRLGRERTAARTLRKSIRPMSASSYSVPMSRSDETSGLPVPPPQQTMSSGASFDSSHTRTLPPPRRISRSAR